MRRVLTITNGDCAVEAMQKAELTGDFLPWRDLLHEGPVPDGLSLVALSQVRAKYIADTIPGAGNFETIAASFATRDKQFQSLAQYDKIVLWFDPDLYDQLQLLQILSELPVAVLDCADVSLICTAHYPGLLAPDELLAQQSMAQPVTKQHLQLATRAWHAFCAPTPDKWQALLTLQTDLLPFLPAAVKRMLQQYPALDSGLCRVGFEALKILAVGDKSEAELFALYQATESKPFLGDSSFYSIVNQLLVAEPALLLDIEEKLSISDFGKQVLSGQRNALTAIGVDRWIGGVHLTQNNIWYWNQANGALQE